ncbi:MAG TPA: MBL fold metallo-hydrolase [Pyrinomonadaceae bacterium]|jgi:glyoxylase-like metal-dependent hydrolase (beta-lactamase superfamily II)
MQFGDYRVEVVSGGEFRLDGGAMFGVVPRALWRRAAEPDEENRVRLGSNCLYVEGAGERVLVETGMGAKWTPRQRETYGVADGPTLAESLFRRTGRRPEDVTIVVNTHLHFDHAGGNTLLAAAGRAAPAFPNARYFVSRAEHEHAESPHERDRASYLPENWRPLAESGQLELKGDDYEVLPGLTLETVPGHSRTMQCVRLARGGRTLYGFADLVPTRAHVPLAWVMGYDLYPVETLEAKRRLLPLAAREGWLCLFYHDADAPLARLREEDGRLRAVGPEDGPALPAHGG